MAKKRNVVISKASAPNELGKPRVDFAQDDYDVLVQQKGYSVIHEQAHRCPCLTSMSRGANTGCKNCGGTGWFFTNAIKTRMVIQSMSNTKNRSDISDWDGSFQVTTRARDGIVLAYMDRITIADSFSEFSEVIIAKETSVGGVTKYMAFLTYPPESINVVFKYSGVDNMHELIDVDSVVIDSKSRYVEFPSAGSYSIRYVHKVQMIVKSIQRDIRDSKTIGVSGEVVKRYPQLVSCIRTHQQFDDIPFVGDGLFDNTYSHG